MLYAVDTETDGLIEHGQIPRLVCLSWATAEDSGLLAHMDGIVHLCSILSDESNRVVLHNAPFDVHVTSALSDEVRDLWRKAYREGRVHDTMLREQLIRHAKGVLCKGKPRLSDLAKEVGYILDKDSGVRTSYYKLAGLPVSTYPKAYIDYAVEDAKATLDVYNHQQQHVGWLADESLHNEAYYWLDLAAVHGVLLDAKRVEEVKEEALSRIDELLPTLLRQKFVELVPKDFKEISIRKPMDMCAVAKRDAVRDAIVRKLREKGSPIYVSKTGARALQYLRTGRQPKGLSKEAKTLVDGGATEEQLRDRYASTKKFVCDIAGTPSIKAYGEYVSLQNMISGDLKDFKFAIEHDGFAHTNINPLKSTGRISSSDPNMQNKRSDGPIRSCFVPREGYVFGGADYGSAELHTLSQIHIELFGRSQLADMLNQGMDMHSYLAAAMKGCDYERFLKNKERKSYKPFRDLAKVKVYGMWGLMGPVAFVAHAAEKGHIITLKESEKLHDLAMELFTDAVPYFNWAKQQKGKTVRLPGTQRYRLCHFPTEAANTPFQGLAADGCKMAFTEISRQAYGQPDSPLYGARPVLAVHDEIIVEMPVAHAENMLHYMQKVMESEFNKLTPDVPVKTEGKLMERWSK